MLYIVVDILNIQLPAHTLPIEKERLKSDCDSHLERAKLFSGIPITYKYASTACVLFSIKYHRPHHKPIITINIDSGGMPAMPVEWSSLLHAYIYLLNMHMGECILESLDFVVAVVVAAWNTWTTTTTVCI